MDPSFRRRLGAVLVAGAVALMAPPGADAQAVDPAKLEAFVLARLAVRDLAAEWNPRIREALSREEAAEMIGQASAEMAAAIEGAEGIDPDEYQQIREAERSDPRLAAQIKRITQLLEGTGTR